MVSLMLFNIYLSDLLAIVNNEKDAHQFNGRTTSSHCTS